MDKGAHFRRCDLQVHTPRDLQWVGAGAVTTEEREQYAREFVAACQARGIEAVAITDHHDMTFVRHIRDAARVATPPVTVFPGMELTLGVPCQALLIFDADFPDDLFQLAMTALAIVPAPEAEAKTGPIGRLNPLTTLRLVQDELDKHTYLRNRYILLPNVSEGGTSTLLRSGHAGHYADMPCVGGYLDGSSDQLGTGNRRILDGSDTNYGSKRLGLFQTSDARRRDFTTLGEHSTWVKWASPTAEALRQACLARESRLSQEPPRTPLAYITAIDVSNCSFLGPLALEWNPQFNALIGGRGTGKSTILEYIRWALCETNDEQERVNEETSLRVSLIEQTLKPHAGVVTVHLVVNGVSHTVRRSSVDGTISLKIGEGSLERSSAADVRAILPLQAYSQKQLSGVGVRLDELRRFVREPVRAALAEFSRRLDLIADGIRTSYAALAAFNRLRTEERDAQRLLLSLEEQAHSLRAEVTGLSPDDMAIVSAKADHDRGASQYEALALATERLRAYLRAATEGLEKLQVPSPTDSALVEEAAEVRSQIAASRAAIAERLGALEAALGQGGAIAQPRERWMSSSARYLSEYDAARSRAVSHQGRLEQLAAVDLRVAETRRVIAERQVRLQEMGQPDVSFAEARDEWYTVHEERAKLLEQQCARLTSLSDGQIKATLAAGGVTDAVEERLRQALTGANIRREKVQALVEGVRNATSPIREWGAVLDELQILVNSSSTEHDTRPPIARLLAAGLGEAELRRVAGKLSVDAWADLATASLDDQPTFQYRLREDQYIPFGRASAGQQATSLLWALLNQEGPPLVIDQPEDDLDNQILLKVVERIWHTKSRRQLLFSSHNANVVVNGDADLVVCCDYRIAGEQAGGRIRSEGAIDQANVRDDIASIMEGGKDAFRLRKEKYGF